MAFASAKGGTITVLLDAFPATGKLVLTGITIKRDLYWAPKSVKECR